MHKPFALLFIFLILVLSIEIRVFTPLMHIDLAICKKYIQSKTAFPICSITLGSSIDTRNGINSQALNFANAPLTIPAMTRNKIIIKLF